ncbi:MAG: 16S rRNA (cytosine(1402)-N(4))-methyltransferase RsmH [Bradymonadales bacterium]|nr:MAG: 16S rRNA (cytosine(1402)-N(4))-methyltransferase RsmH [Bradymonadales bacterium]
MQHIPVLTASVLEKMAWSEPIHSLLDATVGGGGHLRLLLENCPSVERLVALDQDLVAIGEAKKNLKDFPQVEFFHGSFGNFLKAETRFYDRILMDLGVSSFQLDSAERGFSFQKDGPLDMRMNPEAGKPAWQRLAEVSERDFAKLLFEYGEEPRARRLARTWVRERKTASVKTTEAFVRALGYRLDSKDHRGRHPLTRTFQAIRVWVNDEMGQLDLALQEIPRVLAPAGRLGVITFHSLEDRRVKLGLRGKLKAINRKVIQASDEETLSNPRARSAKLRVYEKVLDE